MKKKTILFPIEIKARELNSKILLSLECAKRGMRAYIGSKTAINRLYPKLDSGIFFYKSSMPLDRVKNIRKTCSHFVILDEEMGPAVPNSKNLFKTRIPKKLIPLIDRYFVLGKNHLEEVLSVTTMAKEDIAPTGWPRVDLWRPDFVSLFEGKIREIKAKYGDYVLLSSNFGVTSERMLGKWMREIDKMNIDASSKKLWKEKMINKYESFNQYCNILYKISKSNINVKIIVRPHPADDHNGWHKKVGGLRNIEVIYQGEISPWLYASKGLLHYGCTTGVQAGIAGIPSWVYKPPTGELGNTPAFKVSEKADDIKDIFRFFEQLDKYDKSQIQAETLQKIAPSVNSINGEFASSKIAKVLSRLKSEKIYPAQFSKGDLAYLEARNVGYKGLLLKNKLIGSNEISPKSQKIPGGIEAGEIKGFIEMIAAKIGLNVEEVKLRKISRNLFEIECM